MGFEILSRAQLGADIKFLLNASIESELGKNAVIQRLSYFCELIYFPYLFQRQKESFP